MTDNKVDDRGGFLWGLLGFLVPVPGLIFYLFMRKNFPRNAKACAIGIILGVAALVLFIVVYYLLVLSLVMSL